MQINDFESLLVPLYLYSEINKTSEMSVGSNEYMELSFHNIKLYYQKIKTLILILYKKEYSVHTSRAWNIVIAHAHC